MPTPSPANVLLGRGEVYFDRYDTNGARTGFRHLGNCDAFSVGTETEKITMKDYTQSTTANYAETLSSTNVNLSISGFEFDTENLALALLGTTSTFTQTSGSVTGETVIPSTATGIKGKYFRTAGKKITSLVVKQGATVLTAGTDYTIIDANAGVVRLLPTGGATDGTAVTVDYSRPAILAAAGITRVAGAVVAECIGEVMFRGNNATGQNQLVRVYKASLTPNGELGLISDEYGKWTLQGKALSDAGGTYGGSVGSPYFEMQEIK